MSIYDFLCMRDYFKHAGNESQLGTSAFIGNISVLNNFTYCNPQTPQNLSFVIYSFNFLMNRKLILQVLVGENKCLQ